MSLPCKKYGEYWFGMRSRLRKLCWVPWWCQFNAKIQQPDLRFESNISTERGSILLGQLIRCVFMTSHSLVTSGRQYWCLGFRSVEGSEGESLLWWYSDWWPVKFMAGVSLRRGSSIGTSISCVYNWWHGWKSLWFMTNNIHEKSDSFISGKKTRNCFKLHIIVINCLGR